MYENDKQQNDDESARKKDKHGKDKGGDIEYGWSGEWYGERKSQAIKSKWERVWNR